MGSRPYAGEMTDQEGLDPNDPRPPYQQVANALRAAILTRTLSPGEKLPSGRSVGVALRRRSDDRAAGDPVAARRGPGRVPAGLRGVRAPAGRAAGGASSAPGAGVQRAQRDCGLRRVLRRDPARRDQSEPLDQIQGGSTPVRTRSECGCWSRTRPGRGRCPARVEDLEDSPSLPQARHGDHVPPHPRRWSTKSTSCVSWAWSWTPSPRSGVMPSVPMFKVYVLNGAEVFFGYYPVVEHEVARWPASPTKMWDLMGKDTVLLSHTARRRPGLDELPAGQAGHAVVRIRLGDRRPPLRDGLVNLIDVMRPVRHVLLDFDGPVCSVFGELPAPGGRPPVGRGHRRRPTRRGRRDGPARAADRCSPAATTRRWWRPRLSFET